jgi:hypothetical protein
MIAVFVPGVLRNPLNGSWGHPLKHARTNREWRERTQSHLLAALRLPRTRMQMDPAAPKRITITAHVGAEWDDDGIPAAVKPCRDALKDMRIINDDKPSAGHVFAYAQIVSRGKGCSRGVKITVEPLLAAP